LSKYFTGGFRIETDGNVFNAGPTADFVLGKVGIFDLSLAGSLVDKEYGYAGSVGYTFSTRVFNFRLSGKGFTKNYSTLSLAPLEDKPRLESTSGVGFNLGRLGSLSASHSVTSNRIETDTKRTTLFYSKRLSGGLFLNANASRTETEDVVETASVNLSFLLGRGSSGSLNRRIQENRISDTLSLQKNAPTGPGFGYRLLATQEEDDLGESGIDESVSIQYNGPYGVYSTDYRRRDEVDSYDLNASGAISLIDGSLHLSRPITNSFALVKVGRLENVKVNSNNQYMGKTSSRGKLLVPGLISYSNNKLSIEDRDIPLNYEIGEIEKYVSTPLRAGGIVKFDILKLQGFTGYLFFIQKGERMPAQYAGLEIKTKEKLFETIVGKGGEFYLENIPSGEWPARLFLKDRHCAFKITFPESDEIFVDMGEIACEIK
jgi:outer membrane usher protein